MKLITYRNEEHEQLGALIEGQVYAMDQLHPELPNSMNLFLNYWDDYLPIAQAAERENEEDGRANVGDGDNSRR